MTEPMSANRFFGTLFLVFVAGSLALFAAHGATDKFTQINYEATR